MGFIGKIFGGGTVKKGLDLADKAFYTDQEKANMDLKLAQAYGQNSPASSKARRFMMYLFCVPFMLCFLTGFVHLLLGNSAEINNIINYVNLWNLPALVGGILLFYFGRQAMAEAQSNKRIKNLALLKKEEAKVIKPKYSKEEQKLLNSSLPNIKLIRTARPSNATQGVLVKDEEIFCLTMEKAWRDNKSNVSCIPAGVYKCEMTPSSMDSDGDAYQVLDVPNRTSVKIHAGNEQGDSQGCILLGSATELGKVDGKAFQFQSKKAVRAFEKAMNKKPFVLEIVEVV